MNLLEVNGLSISFGGLKAVQDVSFNVPQGKIVSVIGPNGAGKTTIFNMLTGFYLPDRGSIRLDGMEMVGKKSYEFISCGIARTFQNIRLYTQMSVLENVLIGYQCRMQQSLWDGLFNTPQKRRTEAQALEKARAALEGINLLQYENERCVNLPYGKQKVLEIARALMSEPKLLMLDEPSMGLAPILVEQIFDIIRELHAAGTTILLVEQNAQAALSVADRAYVLETGKISLTGTGAELMASDAVRKAYLGG